MTATGPLIVGTGANDSSVGGATASWANVGNITASDTTYANASPGSMAGAGGPATQYAVGTMSGNQFTIASDQIIDGIVVEWFVRNNVGTTVDSAVRIVKGGVVGATDKASGTSWPGTLGGRTYGGSTDLWGETWLYSDINAANFGAAISAVNSGGDSQCDIDYCQITVYHHTAFDADLPIKDAHFRYQRDAMWFFKQSTAGQEMPLGPFLDETDGATQMTALTIANTDIKIQKSGATTEASKNSGGATHIANGRYYAVFDATDTDTIGSGRVSVHVATALPVWVDFVVLHANIYDWWFGSAAPAVTGSAVNVTQINGTSIAGTGTQVADAFVAQYNVASPVFTNESVNQTGDGYAVVSSGTHGNAALKTLIDTVDTVADAVKVKTDQLTFTVSNQVDANALTTAGIDSQLTTIDGIVDAILLDTAEIGAAGAGLTALATQASVDVIDGIVDSILLDTAEIGAAGAGLTAVPWNAAWDAEVQSEVDDALVAQRLDELLNADSDIDGAAPPTVGSVFHELMTSTTGSFTYDQTTDSLEAARNNVGTAGAGLTATDVMECRLGFAFTSSAGTEARFIAWLQNNGQKVVLPSGTCAIAIREEGAGSDLFSASAAAPEADGTFAIEQASPGFTADRIYKATVTIVDDAAATWVSIQDVPVWA